jgi:hypothetical protein
VSVSIVSKNWNQIKFKEKVFYRAELGLFINHVTQRGEGVCLVVLPGHDD